MMTWHEDQIHYKGNFLSAGVNNLSSMAEEPLYIQLH